MFARGLTAAVLSLGLMGYAGSAEAKPRKAKVAQKEAPPPAPTAPKREDLASLIAGPIVGPSFFLFSDTQISYRHVFTAAEPNIPKLKTANPSDGRDIPKNVLNIAHADSWAYGTNFFSVDILKSGSQDPAGTRNGFPGRLVTTTYDYGATEAYGLYRGTLSGNKIFGKPIFVIPGLVKDVSLSFGFDANTKNTAFGPNKRLAVGGLVFSIDVPVGFLNVAVHASHEWNRNGFAVAPYREVEFNTTPEFEITYNFPLDGILFGLPFKLAGFNNIVMPKGRVTTPVSVPTNVEFLSRTNLVLDVGKLIWDKPGKLDVFAGFQYWRNKFGNDKDYFNRASTPAIYQSLIVNGATIGAGFAGAGAEEKTALVGVAYHL